MTTRREREAEDEDETRNDPSPVSGTMQEDSYVRSQQGGRIPVRKDQAGMEDPVQPSFSNTNAQLGMEFSPFLSRVCLPPAPDDS